MDFSDLYNVRNKEAPRTNGSIKYIVVLIMLVLLLVFAKWLTAPPAAKEPWIAMDSQMHSTYIM